MNKIILVLTAFLILLSSCNNSDEAILLDGALSENILGDWDVHSFVINSCPDITENVPMTTANENGCIVVWGEELCVSVTFLKNGKGSFNYNQSSTSEESVQPFEYTVDEEAQVVNAVGTTYGDEINFTLKNDQLSFEMDEEGCICRFGFQL